MKILVIGDSHYCGDCERCGIRGNCSMEEMAECCDFTINTVKNYLQTRKGKDEIEGWMIHTFLAFDKIFYGDKNVSAIQSEELWNNISFMNFVQTAASDEPDNRNYTLDEYAESSQIIAKQITILQPDVIFVWGNRAYNALSGENWHDGTDYFNGYYEFANGHKSYCIRVHHPSRANFDRWHKDIKDFINKIYING